MTLMNKRVQVSRGAANTWVVVSILLILAFALTAGATVWAYMQYFSEKNTVDTQIEAAVATAKKNQADSDAANFAAQEKLPTRTFVGPDDYGRLSFSYPKTWSVYVNQDQSQNTTGSSSGGTLYAAYLNPISVPPVINTGVSQTQQYALQVTIVQQDYNTVVNSYSDLVKKGSLTSSAIKVNGEDGLRLDGSFNTSIRGSAVLFKIRDTTVTVQTDADTFGPDFNTLISTIKFNS